jgi:hypothetical protein
MKDAEVQSGPDLGEKVRNSTIGAGALMGPRSTFDEPS